MNELFTRSRDLASCPSIKQSHLGKCSKEKFHTLSLPNDGTLRNTEDFASALSYVNLVKTSDLLAFLLIRLFSSLGVDFQKVGGYECIREGDSLLITLKNLRQSFFPIPSVTWWNHNWAATFLWIKPCEKV